MQLYPYQQRIKELILAGQSVIVQAPTGSGKTLGSLAPYIEAYFDLPAEAFPRKCIYSVPMRVLANQFHTEYENYADSYRRIYRREIAVGIQTGDRPEDPKLENSLIFSTIDQTLISFLNIPYALGTGSANLNAGAVMSSYLVFDELHLFDPDTMLPTTLEMLRMLRGITPFIIMTATFSSQMLQRLAELLDAVVVPEDAQAREAMQDIGSQVGKVRRFHGLDTPLTAEQVLRNSSDSRRIICICNTVHAAQELYLGIKALLEINGKSETQVTLLHSRFYKNDRDKKEAWIREHFGTPQADYAGPPLILVATQVIEVGVDATCDVMHTEIAPAASILQRAGRCARRAHETGDVYVYLPRTEAGDPDYTPYFLASQAKKTERGRHLCEATWAALRSAQFQGQHMSFQQEQALINLVHTPIDQEILDQLADKRHTHRDTLLRTMQGLDKGMAPDLIRNINTRFVMVHPDPAADEHLRHNPWHYDGFALHPGTIAKAFKAFEELGSDIPWLMQTAQRLEEKSGSKEEAPSRQRPEYHWYQLQESKEVFQSAVIAIHPKLARYDEELGFRFELSTGNYDVHKRRGKQRQSGYSYHKETYAEHIAGLYRAYRHALPDPQSNRMRLPLIDEIAHTVWRLERNPAWQISSDTVDYLLRMIFVCHDLGKLNVQWQAWAHKWQRRVGEFYGDVDKSLPPNYMAAHTDFEPTNEQKAAQKKLGKRPPHAGESAMAGGRLLYACCQGNQPLWKAVMTAITRHHHAGSNSHQPFVMHKFAKPAVHEALDAVGLDRQLAEQIFWQVGNDDVLDKYLVNFDRQGIQEVLFYFLLIRVLRLADQRSQER